MIIEGLLFVKALSFFEILVKSNCIETRLVQTGQLDIVRFDLFEACFFGGSSRILEARPGKGRWALTSQAEPLPDRAKPPACQWFGNPGQAKKSASSGRLAFWAGLIDNINLVSYNNDIPFFI